MCEDEEKNATKRQEGTGAFSPSCFESPDKSGFSERDRSYRDGMIGDSIIFPTFPFYL